MSEQYPFTQHEWEQTPKAVQDFVLAMQKTIEQQQKTIEALEARVAELEERLKLNSKNSSKPPSSDLHKPTSQRKNSQTRKRGGQPGHKGKSRKLLPPEEVDQIVSCIPKTCSHCDSSLPEMPDDSPHRHQVTEVPPIKPMVTEYQIHALRCPRCLKTTRGQLPEGVTFSAFGPRLQAIIALCSGLYFNSRRATVRLLKSFFGIELSVGSVSRLEQKTSDALAMPVEEAHRFGKQSDAVNVDETGYREEKKKSWIWVAVTQLVVVFCVGMRRSKKALLSLIGDDYCGIVTSDRYPAYKEFENVQRQLCWAHLIRDFKRWVLRGGSSQELGEKLLAQVRQMFEQLNHARDGTLRWHLFRVRMKKIRKEIEGLLVQAKDCEHQKTAATAKEILKQKEALWTFVLLQEIEPTNNAAERALRPAVIWRKRSFGADSKRGSRFAERILTTNATLKAQQRDVLEFVTSSIQAHRKNELPPSLLPR